MAVIAAFLQKLKYFLSKSIVPTENGFVNLISSIYSPHLHILTVILAATLIYFVFKQARSQKTNEKHSATLKATTPQDLSWLNKILTWTFVTASQGMPPVVETWIQDINIALAKQKNSFKVLVYGLREGSAPPWLKEITEVKRTNNELNGKVLLETSEMGLLITVQETLGSKEISSSYSAIFVHFQCWFTARLVRYHGNAVLQLQPAEKNPIFRIKMKPLTKQTLVSTVPESVAEAVKSAFLNSMFFIDASTWEPLSPNLDAGHEEEESCYADSDDDITFKDVNELPSTPRMAPRGMVNGLTKLNLNKKARPVMANSVPNSRLNTPTKESLRNISPATKGLSGSLGSLSITRTPSGRGPAKPIRVREKQLLVKVLKADIVDRYEAGPCQFHLDSPNQRKKTQLDDASLNDRVSFDLSSRSSQLEITVWPKAASPKSNVDPIGKSTVSVDAIDMEKCNKVAAPLKATNSDEIIGSLHLEFMVMENAQSNPSLLKRYSFSGPDQKTPMFPDQDLDQKPVMNEEKVAKQSENKSKMSSSPSATKVTMVTSTKVKSSKGDSSGSDSNSPMKQVTGVSYIQDSVAESALRDLSSSPDRKSNVTKTSIMIRSVERNPDKPVDDTVELNEVSVASSPDENEFDKNTQELVLEVTEPESEPDEAKSEVRSGDESLHPVESSPAMMESPFHPHSEVKLRTKVGQTKNDDIKVRRTRSLLFNSHKKQKHQRSSLTADDMQDSLSPVPLDLVQSKKKSGSMTKLFSRITRKKKSNGFKEGKNGNDSITEVGEPRGDETSLNSVQNGNHDESSTKLKRSRSLRGLLKGKKSPKKS